MGVRCNVLGALLTGATLITTLVYTSHIIATDYNDAVHGGVNRTANPNATATRCVEVSKSKLNGAKDNMLTAITLNTLLIAAAALMGFKCIAWVVSCGKCSDGCRKACNYVLIFLYAGLVGIAAVVLTNIDMACKRLANAVVLLFIVTPISGILLFRFARPIFVSDRSEKLLDIDV